MPTSYIFYSSILLQDAVWKYLCPRIMKECISMKRFEHLLILFLQVDLGLCKLIFNSKWFSTPGIWGFAPIFINVIRILLWNRINIMPRGNVYECKAKDIWINKWLNVYVLLHCVFRSKFKMAGLKKRAVKYDYLSSAISNIQTEHV